MSTSTLGTFVALLKKSQILAPEQVEQLGGELRTQFPEAKQLARELIKRGWVTAYQVNQISQGKGGDLVLGSYIILERLGEGGMGQVFKARHRSMGRVVALKLLRKERLANPDAIKRFHREIQAAARLSHPNIVMAYDADHVGNSHFFVMEHVDGVDLSNLVKKRGPVSVPRACNYMVQATLGLQHAHEQGMVHRDIKPHNLLLTRDGQTVKILDMGLARLGEADQDSNYSQLTQDGKVVGTPDYIAPEQARNSHTADIRSDLYSLGCTFYFLISGRVPFPGGGSIMEKLMKHQTEDPIPIQLVAPELSDRIAAVVHKMIRRNPDERYQTPAEVAAALEPFMGRADGDTAIGSRPMVDLGDLGSLTSGTPASAPRLKVGASASTPTAASSSRKTWLLLAALAGIFVLGTMVLGIAAVALMGRNSSKVSSNKDQEPGPPDKDGNAKDRKPPDEKKTGWDHLADMPIPVAKRPPHALAGLVGVLGEPRGRHWSGAPISRLIFSRDSRLLAAAAAFGDNGVHIWDPDTLRERGRLTSAGGFATNMTFGADSSWLALTGMDGNVRVFDVTEAGFGKTLAQYQIPSLGAVAFTPDGRLAVGTIFDREARTTRTVKVWDTRTGTLRRTYTINAGMVTAAVLSPAGLKLAISSLNTIDAKGTASVKLYDLEADKLLHNLEIGPGWAIPMFVPDGKQVLVVTSTSLRTYDVGSGEMKHEIPVTFPTAPTLSPDGKTLAFMSRARDKATIHFYDVAHAKVAPYITEVDQTVFFGNFTPDSKSLIVSGFRQPVLIIDAASGKALPPLKGWNGGVGTVAVVAPNGRRLALTTSEPALRMWDFPSREELFPAPPGRAGPVQFMALVGDRAIWAGSTEFETGKTTSILRRWDLPRAEPIVYRDAAPPGMATMTWAYDRHHNRVAFPHPSEVVGAAPGIKIIHAATGKDIATLPALPNATWMSALAFTSDGKSLACATWSRKDASGKSVILFRDAASGAEQFQIPDRVEQTVGLFFSGNGKMLATVGRDNTLKLFDIASRAEKPRPATPGQTSQVSCVAWSADSRLLATGGPPQGDKPFELWEPATGKVWHRLPGKAAATALAFGRDGNAFAGADADGNVTLWNLSSEKPIRHWQLAGPAVNLQFSHDGQYLITGNANGTIYVLHLDDAAAKP